MKPNTLPKLVSRSKKRLGRGHGSGKVKTSGRGQKGQKARGKVNPAFEGGQLSIIKRLPLLRGKSKHQTVTPKALVVPVSALEILAAKSVVTLKLLKKEGIVPEKTKHVKVLGNGTLTKALTVDVPISESAKVLVVKAGGSVN